MAGNVLIVTQTNAEILSPLRDALLDDGYSMKVAADTETALQLARQDPPVAVIMDIDVRPEADLLLCSWLRTDPTTVAVKLLVTAQDNQQRLAALKAGADELLTAPLDWVEVRTRLRTMQAGRGRLPNLEDFLAFTPDLILGANPVDILGTADLLSHDLKNPISISISTLELLREYAQDRLQDDIPLAEREVGLCDSALTSCRRLVFLIDDMLDLAKIQADAYPMRPEPLDMADLVYGVLTANVKATEQKKLTIDLEIQDALPLANGDRALVERICNALLDNTLMFSRQNEQATLKLQLEGDYLALYLIDHGRLIAPEYTEAIFGRAVQWEARYQGSRVSVAMGLPFARAAIRRMGGDLVASSNPEDHTTTFYMRLPLVTQGKP